MAVSLFLSSASALVLLSLCKLCSGNIFIQSPTITNLGNWGPVEKCPDSTYVIGMQLKVESRQPLFHDNTALNGIRFFCIDLSSTKEPPFPVIQSTVADCGSWRTEFYCTEGFVVGFQLKSQGEQGKDDDTGANNLRVMCSDGQIIEGEGTTWGTWTQAQKCRKRQAICSIQTQVEGNKGTGDDSSLNNLRAECCDIPNLAANCTPTDFWDLVAECDNTYGFTPTTCTYERRIGISFSPVENNPTFRSLRNLGLENFRFGNEAQLLSRNFRLNTNTQGSTGYDWKSPTTDIWTHESKITVSFEVPPGVRSSMTQVVGTCGNYLVRAAKFQRVDAVASPPESVSGSADSNITLVDFLASSA